MCFRGSSTAVPLVSTTLLNSCSSGCTRVSGCTVTNSCRNRTSVGTTKKHKHNPNDGSRPTTWPSTLPVKTRTFCCFAILPMGWKPSAVSGGRKHRTTRYWRLKTLGKGWWWWCCLCCFFLCWCCLCWFFLCCFFLCCSICFIESSH